MPIRPENKKLYPANWPEISKDIRFNRAGNKCEWDGCGAVNGEPHPITKSKVVLTVMHLDHDPTNNDYSNLRAACQRCHNRYDAAHRRENRKKNGELGKS